MSNQEPQEVDVLASIFEYLKVWINEILPEEWAVAWAPASE